MAVINGVFGICLLLFSGVHLSLAMNVNIPQKVYKVARGDNVTIPCTFPPPVGDVPVTVTWSVPATVDQTKSTIVTYYNPTTVTVSKKYKGRVSLEHNIPAGKATLQLRSTISADTRIYECEVKVAGDEEEAQSATTNLVVLVAPSIPVCQVAGAAEYGQNINLTCRSEEGTPTPTYRWQSHDVNSIPRPNPPKATDQNGILSLYNISQDTSGYYICTSTNEIRSAKCNLTLVVMPPSMNMASTFGIIGAVAAFAIILGIIIFCCCCRKKNKEEGYAMGTPEGGEYTDKDPKHAADGQDEQVNYEEEHPVKSADRRDPRDDRSERSYDRRSDYDDRRGHYPDRRDDSSDRRERYEGDDRYPDRRDRYDDRSDRYDDRSDRYDDHRDRYDDRRDRYDDRRDRYDSDRYSDRYDSRDRPPSVPPSVPPSKPRDPRN